MTSNLPPLVQAFSGAVGSATANALVYPLDLLTTRLQLDPPRRTKTQGGLYGAVLIFRHILKKYGWRAFYDGLWADTCATLLSNFFYFYCYAFLRSLSTRRLIPFRGSQKRLSSAPHKPTMIEELVLGFIAGIASRAISTPLNIVTLKLQNEREVDDDDAGNENRPYMGMADVIKAIYKESGLAGFWRGFETSALLSLNPSITLACYQMYGRVLTLVKSSRSSLASLSLKEAPANITLHPREAFFGAAICNSIAVSILYPLILAKKRLQSSTTTTTWEVLTDAYQGKDALNLPRTEKEASGIQCLYQGYQMKIITGFLSQGVTFLVKGRIEQVIIAVYMARLRNA